MKKGIMLFSFLLVCSMGFAQYSINWQRSLGGGASDAAIITHPTPDGGYIMAGNTNSRDGDVVGFHLGWMARSDIWVVKLSPAGAIQWQRCLGGVLTETVSDLQLTSDGGYIIAGNAVENIFSGDVGPTYGGTDAWIIKLANDGTIAWQKCYGGTADDDARSVRQTSDGGYIVAGHTHSNDIDVSGNHGSSDFWIFKLGATGQLQWQKCLGGSKYESARSIQLCADGGYIVAGSTISSNGDVTGLHGKENDYWVVKLGPAGNIQWQRALGGSKQDHAYAVGTTSDGGYIVAGSSESNNGDVSGHHTGNNRQKDPSTDYWIVKLNSTGGIQWQRSLGGDERDIASFVKQLNDGSYIVSGYSRSVNGDVSGNHGNADVWLVKLSTTGTIVWEKSFGGAADDHGHAVLPDSDGGLILSAGSYSNNGDVSGNHGSMDCWIVKLVEENGMITRPFIQPETVPGHFRIFPNPAAGGQVSVELPADLIADKPHISIFNALGTELKRINIQASIQVIPLNGFRPGVYFYRVNYMGRTIYTGELIVQ